MADVAPLPAHRVVPLPSSLTGIFRMGEARNEFLTITNRR